VVNAINAVMMFLRAFRFMNLNSTMAMFRATLNMAMPSLAALWACLLLVFLSVSTACFVAFGKEVSRFRTLFDSIIALFQYSAGDYNFKEMAEVQPVLGPVYTLGYMILVYFCLMNLFMSILSEFYATAVRRNDANSDKLLVFVRAELYRRLEKTIPFFERRRLRKELEEKRLFEIKKGIIVDDEEMNALRYRFRTLCLVIGKEQALKDCKIYQQELDTTAKSWVSRDLFFEMNEHINNYIEAYELQKSKSTKEEVLLLFDKVDADGSGFVEADEVELMIEELGVIMDDKQKNAMLSLIEEDCDGSMSFDEFYKWYKEFKPQFSVGKQLQANKEAETAFSPGAATADAPVVETNPLLETKQQE